MIYMKLKTTRKIEVEVHYDLVGDTRAEQMYHLRYEQGFTLEEIGKIFKSPNNKDLSKQRVHQIINKYVKSN